MADLTSKKKLQPSQRTSYWDTVSKYVYLADIPSLHPTQNEYLSPKPQRKAECFREGGSPPWWAVWGTKPESRKLKRLLDLWKTSTWVWVCVCCLDRQSLLMFMNSGYLKINYNWHLVPKLQPTQGLSHLFQGTVSQEVITNSITNISLWQTCNLFSLRLVSKKVQDNITYCTL